jgi:hypothetical protein
LSETNSTDQRPNSAFGYPRENERDISYDEVDTFKFYSTIATEAVPTEGDSSTVASCDFDPCPNPKRKQKCNPLKLEM